jgi:hypothetical protein
MPLVDTLNVKNTSRQDGMKLLSMVSLNKNVGRLVLILLALGLSACQTTRTIVIGHDCDNFFEITYSEKNDTDITKQLIREHNAVYKALCVNIKA